MKKVLFLITKATRGGAQKYVSEAVRQEQERGNEPIVLYGEEGALAHELQTMGIQTYRISSLARDIALMSDIASFFQVWRHIRITTPNEIHLHSSKAAALGAIAARVSGVQKIYFTVHGWPFKEKQNALARTAVYFVSWLTAFLSHEVYVVSRTDEELGKRMWGVRKKIHYVPISAPAITFLSRIDAEKALSLHGEGVRIVTIAELTPNKGIAYAIEAMSELRSQGVKADYFIIGDGEEHASLVAAAKERGISHAVHFLGFKKDAAQYLKAFDIFLLPSVKEGMPYVLLEAAQAGLPIIATNVVDPEFLKNNPGVVHIDPSNSAAITNAIKQILEARD
jgi:glycosyltransferase involved in cell wall biosynthesis